MKLYVTWYAISVFIVPFIILTYTHIYICREIWLNWRIKRQSLVIKPETGKTGGKLPRLGNQHLLSRGAEPPEATHHHHPSGCSRLWWICHKSNSISSSLSRSSSTSSLPSSSHTKSLNVKTSSPHHRHHKHRSANGQQGHRSANVKASVTKQPVSVVVTPSKCQGNFVFKLNFHCNSSMIDCVPLFALVDSKFTSSESRSLRHVKSESELCFRRQRRRSKRRHRRGCALPAGSLVFSNSGSVSSDASLSDSDPQYSSKADHRRHSLNPSKSAQCLVWRSKFGPQSDSVSRKTPTAATVATSATVVGKICVDDFVSKSASVSDVKSGRYSLLGDSGSGVGGRRHSANVANNANDGSTVDISGGPRTPTTSTTTITKSCVNSSSIQVPNSNNPVNVFVPRTYHINASANARMSNPRIHSMQGLTRAKIKTVKITLVVITCYVLCSSPFICVQLWAQWWPNAQEMPIWKGKLYITL